MHRHEKQQKIWNFWFGDDSLNLLTKSKFWFAKDAEFDALVKSTFEPMLDQAEMGAFDDWPLTKDGALALVLLCDQFPRNVYRDDDRAFAFDHRALRATQIAIANRFDTQLRPVERCFLYLPLEHAEDLAIQDLSVSKFDELVNISDSTEADFIALARDYAIKHREIIARFGRFPHRNDLLGRSSTRDEAKFLKTPGSTF